MCCLPFTNFLIISEKVRLVCQVPVFGHHPSRCMSAGSYLLYYVAPFIRTLVHSSPSSSSHLSSHSSPPFSLPLQHKDFEDPQWGKEDGIKFSFFFFFFFFLLLCSSLKAYSLKTLSAPHWCTLPSSASSLLQETNWGLLTWWTFRRFITSCGMNCSQIIVVIKAG